MEKKIKEERIKELNSRKKWEKIENGYWFILQSFMLSVGLGVAVTFFLDSIGFELKSSWLYPLSMFFLVISIQTIYMVTKSHLNNIKEIEDKYKNLIDKID
jgi:hypothetical protein